MHTDHKIKIIPCPGAPGDGLQPSPAFFAQVEEALLLGLLGQGRLTQEQYNRIAGELARRSVL